jgi:hypothetical protein
MALPDIPPVDRLGFVVKDYLACKELVDFVSKAALGMKELHAEIDELNKADHELREFLRSLPKQHPINLDSEERLLSDKLTSGTSQFEQLRRKQAKDLARRLLRATHPDLNPNGSALGITFEQVRALANEGEVEVLQYLRKKHGFSVNGDEPGEEQERDMLENADTLLYVKMQKYKSTPGFKLATLYYANREAFVLNTKRILSEKAADLRLQLTEMMYPEGSADARAVVEDARPQSAEQRVEELGKKIDGLIASFMNPDQSDLYPELLRATEDALANVDAGNKGEQP